MKTLNELSSQIANAAFDTFTGKLVMEVKCRVDSYPFREATGTPTSIFSGGIDAL